MARVSWKVEEPSGASYDDCISLSKQSSLYACLLVYDTLYAKRGPARLNGRAREVKSCNYFPSVLSAGAKAGLTRRFPCRSPGWLSLVLI